MAKGRRTKSRRSRSRRGGDDMSPSSTGMTQGLNPDLPGYSTPVPMTPATTGAMTMATTTGGRRRKSSRRGRRGGVTPGASGWVTSNFGSSAEQQFMNTFGNSGNGDSGNLIPTLTGAPAVVQGTIPQGSLAQYAGPAQNGGKSRRRGKKGGYWAQVIETALVPFGLLGLQNYYGKRTRRNRN